MLYSAEKGRTLEGFLVRRTSKDHGLRGQVEGNFAGHKRVIILDDVITSGDSELSRPRRPNPTRSTSCGC